MQGAARGRGSPKRINDIPPLLLQFSSLCLLVAIVQTVGIPVNKLYLGLVSFALVTAGSAQASTVLTFDDIPVTGINVVNMTNQYAGVTFSGARVLNSPGQLNDINFVPYTGPNVIANDADDGSNGLITLKFDAPVTFVGAFVTSFKPVTFSAFDGATLLGTTQLAVPNYLNGGSGSPNAFLSLSFAEITSVQFNDNFDFGSFTLDNVTLDGGAFSGIGAVPEPATWALFILGFGAMGCFLRSNRRASPAFVS